MSYVKFIKETSVLAVALLLPSGFIKVSKWQNVIDEIVCVKRSGSNLSLSPLEMKMRCGLVKCFNL